MQFRQRFALSFALVLAQAPVSAQAATTVPVDGATRTAVIARLADSLESHYVFRDIAHKIATSLRARDALGGYARATDVSSFAKALADDLRSTGNDLHFHVAHDPGFGESPGDTRTLPGPQDAERLRHDVARHGYGIDSLRRLPGNVGYLDVHGFPPAEYAGGAVTAAMTLLSGTDALILDLRRNGGGEPDGVAHLLSHFFAQGDSRHLNDIYSRTGDSTRQYWTNPAVAPRYTGPLYVLTSRRTFSGGEEAAYDLQTQRRATLVGEVTGGGANPGEGYALGHGFVAFIPNGRSINPITGTNWEHTGVTPDIAVPAADAQRVAHVAILKSLLLSAVADDQDALRALIARVETGAMEAPDYTPPRP